MSNMNWQKIILGGLLAGVIIDISEGLTNGLFFATDWAAVMKALNVPGDFSPKQLAALNVLGLLTGIATVWLYAAIRPRFGAGPKTAVLAGVAIWFIAYGLGGVFPVITHMYPVGLVATTTSIELVQSVVAALAGAWVYKETA